MPQPVTLSTPPPFRLPAKIWKYGCTAWTDKTKEVKKDLVKEGEGTARRERVSCSWERRIKGMKCSETGRERKLKGAEWKTGRGVKRRRRN